MKKRLYFLDSLRGVAALIVVFTHFLGSLPEQLSYRVFIHNLYLGRCSVLLFFILSGIVLSLVLDRVQKLSAADYVDYLIKRYFRIYLPFFVVTILAFLLFNVTPYQRIHSLSDWFNSVGTQATNLTILFQNIFMNGESIDQLDPVIWSLIVELRISIIFPFLYFFFRKNGVRSCLICLATVYFFWLTYPLCFRAKILNWAKRFPYSAIYFRNLNL
ncbi:acyltransferase [Listeria floridensis FSL S10-1187]|uniref:Acyltransferase n=1 Tax=Listeria floridensis FSL S10-1187 TaxID=1265817 RepID=A0ABP3AX51_9LIST|nr:acyltransferase [Listeria floridensis]EUJ29134.1 acyltransferase [Listeria floridensis FSL S10-1187]